MTHALPTASSLLFWGFLLLPLLMATGLVVAVHSTSGPRAGRQAMIALPVWMGLTGTLSAIGVLDTWAPPPMFLLLVTMLAFLAWSSRRPWTHRLGDLPLQLLVGFQSFRIIVELLIHLAVSEGIAHPTMTWTGTNLDIVAGVSALLLAPFAHRVAPRLLQGWNLAMAGVLIVTVVTGVLAAPTPFRQILGDPPNSWIAHFPFVWLPTILVFSGWLGHIVLFRRLARRDHDAA